ncbi:MAG: protein kinase [Pirellulales bacterium]
MTSNPRILEASDIDRCVESFEQRLAARGSAAIADFLPPADSRHHDETLAELVRVDLEWSWRRGIRKPVESYLAEFPRLTHSPEAIGQIAHEEYRVRRRLGEPAEPSEYARRFGAMADEWPSASPASNGSRGPTGASSLAANVGGGSTGVVRETIGDAVTTAEMPSVGDRFLDFDLVDELGRGTFGRVYLARQSGLADRLVALKVTRAASDESDNLARLQHTNIVPIHSVHRVGRWQAVCMPYFGRTTLAEALRKLARGQTQRAAGRNVFYPTTEIARRDDNADARAEISPRTSYIDAALGIAYELALGVAHAHRRGLVHRDLKPANVLLADDGRAMILDFGLAQSIEPPDDKAMATIGGTLPYMAPEQIAALAHGGDVGPPADIYSLGAILYEILAGRLPFAATKNRNWRALDDLATARKSPPVSLHSIDRNVPRAVDAIVRKCLAFDPAQRYASADDLAEDLRRQRADEPLCHAPDRSPRERIAKWGRRHPNVFSATAIVAIAVLAVALVGGLWATRGQRIARLEAQELAATLRHESPQRYIALTSPDLTTAELRDAVAEATAGLERFGALDADAWRDRPPFALLDEEDRLATSGMIAKTLYFAGRSLERRASSGVDADARSQLHEQATTLLDAAKNVSANVLPSIAAELAASSSRENSDALSRLFEGYDLLAAKRYEDALPLLQAACAESPQDVSAWLLLGNCQVGLRELAEAESTFAVCASMSPHSYVAFYHRGLCRIERERFAAAAADFDRVLQLRPNLYGALVNRAIALQGQQNFAAAERDLTDALADPEAESRLYFLRARVRGQLHDQEGAQRDRREGLRRTPRDELSWVARGLAQLPSSPDRALSDFRAALEINPKSLPALRNVAHVLSERLGKNDEALASLDRVVELAPHDIDARASRGVLAARLGRRDRAFEDAQFVLRAAPNARTTYKVACIYALTARGESSDAAKAIAVLSESMRQDAGLYELARRDADLDAIRNQTEFQTLLKAAAALAPPVAAKRL